MMRPTSKQNTGSTPSSPAEPGTAKQPTGSKAGRSDLRSGPGKGRALRKPVHRSLAEAHKKRAGHPVVRASGAAPEIGALLVRADFDGWGKNASPCRATIASDLLCAVGRDRAGHACAWTLRAFPAFSSGAPVSPAAGSLRQTCATARTTSLPNRCSRPIPESAQRTTQTTTAAQRLLFFCRKSPCRLRFRATSLHASFRVRSSLRSSVTRRPACPARTTIPTLQYPSGLTARFRVPNQPAARPPISAAPPLLLSRRFSCPWPGVALYSSKENEVSLAKTRFSESDIGDRNAHGRAFCRAGCRACVPRQ